MSIIELLEAHLFVPGGFVDPGNHCSCGNYYNNEYFAGSIQLDEHLKHVSEVLEQLTQQLEQEAKAAGYTEAADVLSSEARWQHEQDARRVTGAQIVAQRMSVMEQIMRDRAKELTNGR